MIKIVSGNILEAKEPVIIQQVNCRGVMGAGLAKAIYTKWPQVKQEYVEYCRQYEPNYLLGRYMLVCVGEFKWIVNVFGQLDFGRENVCYTSYKALDRALRSVASNTKLDIAIPYGLGCGLAHGDWNVVLDIIQKRFSEHNVTIYKL